VGPEDGSNTFFFLEVLLDYMGLHSSFYEYMVFVIEIQILLKKTVPVHVIEILRV
jgi:hypothetical protein